MKVDQILDDRHKSYGTFSGVACISGQFRDFIQSVLKDNRDNGNEVWLEVDAEEALLMIGVKIARILNTQNGQNHVDTWRDIAGYATLVAERLEGKTR